MKQNALLSFPAIPAMTYAPGKKIALAAKSSVNLPITYSSSNPEVASVTGNMLTVNQAGTTTLTAAQAGDETYNNIASAITLTISKIPQTLKFSPIATQVYAPNKPIILIASSSAKLSPILFSCDNPAVATLSDNVLTLKGKGTARITATQAGNVNYASASAVQVLTVK
jgi:hypothetical protein